MRDVKQDNIILHVGIYDLNFEKTSSQTARSVIDLTISLETNANTIKISWITPRNQYTNNKTSKVNNGLVNMCDERHILVTGQSKTNLRDVE